ncbi:uncharacterized protein LOC124152834 [Haliotis rufescens]|uniref:uncharacterized protein LOC124152834 n=1 Tax=Haliotis rufescens TaxID=6454 RepID=UPI001EAF9427|nr:uncharacterized protein LOC124152834 [Haliotis rufescens]
MQFRPSLQVCVVFATLVSLSQSFRRDVHEGSDLFSSLSSVEAKRSTIFDRMGRYYGKRSSTEMEGMNGKIRPLYTTEEMRELVSGSPRLLAGIIRGYIDRNGDDLIDEEEMAQLKKRIQYQ